MATSPTEQKATAVLFARVPADLHREARIQAINEGRPVAELVEAAVREYLRRL